MLFPVIFGTYVLCALIVNHGLKIKEKNKVYDYEFEMNHCNDHPFIESDLFAYNYGVSISKYERWEKINSFPYFLLYGNM
jgi:hypothetical protein